MALNACVHSRTLHVRCVPGGFMREGSQTISLRAESHGMSSFFHGSVCLSNFNRLFSSRAFDCLYVSECENYIQDMNVKSKRD